jgi:diacylglycerol kinase (ATP)
MSKKNEVKRAKLIANPGSGPTSRNDQILQVTRALQDLGVALDVALASPHEEAVPIARRAVRDGYKVIIAMGGDDTIWSVMQGIAGSKARLGVIPAGTENNVATSLGIPKDTQEACALIADGHTRKVDLGRVKVKGRKKLYFLEVVTIGIAAALYPDLKKAPKGDLSGVKDAVLKVLRQPTGPKVVLTLDGESSIRVRTMLVVIANLPIIGAHFLVAPDASLDDGLLDISAYPQFSKAELLQHFAQVRELGQSGDGKVQRYRARRVKVKTSPRMKVLADGTPLGKGTVKIKLLRHALRVIAPKKGVGLEAAGEPAGADLPSPVSPTTTADAKEASA